MGPKSMEKEVKGQVLQNKEEQEFTTASAAPPAFAPTNGPEGTVQKKDEKQAADPAASGGDRMAAIEKLEDAIISGAYDDGIDYQEMEVEGSEDKATMVSMKPELSNLIKFYTEEWKDHGSLQKIDSGDLHGKQVDGHPEWVDYLQKLIATRPKWDKHSQAIQRILKVFYTSWGQSIGMEKGSLAEEWFSHVGKSNYNEQSKDFIAGQLKNQKGEFTWDARNWCGQAPTYMIVQYLMKNGLRFKTQGGTQKNWNFIDKKRPGERYQQFLAAVNWEKKVNGLLSEGSQKEIRGKNAYTAPLEPGDRISILTPSSPMSGHVATVLKEFGSPAQTRYPSGDEPAEGKKESPLTNKLAVVSGNAQHRSIKVDQLEREKPSSFITGLGDWTEFASNSNNFINKMDAAHDLRTTPPKLDLPPGMKLNDVYKGLFMDLYQKVRSYPDKKSKDFNKLYQVYSSCFPGLSANAAQVNVILANAGLFNRQDLIASLRQVFNGKSNQEKVKAANAKADGIDKQAGDSVNTSMPVTKDESKRQAWSKRTGKELAKFQPGVHAPADDGHIWVMSIVRNGKLNLNQFRKADGTWDASQLSAYGLEERDPGISYPELGETKAEEEKK